MDVVLNKSRLKFIKKCTGFHTRKIKMKNNENHIIELKCIICREPEKDLGFVINRKE